jgi:hypothetical protein
MHINVNHFELLVNLSFSYLLTMDALDYLPWILSWSPWAVFLLAQGILQFLFSIFRRFSRLKKCYFLQFLCPFTSILISIAVYTFLQAYYLPQEASPNSISSLQGHLISMVDLAFVMGTHSMVERSLNALRASAVDNGARQHNLLSYFLFDTALFYLYLVFRIGHSTTKLLCFGSCLSLSWILYCLRSLQPKLLQRLNEGKLEKKVGEETEVKEYEIPDNNAQLNGFVNPSISVVG